MQFPIIVPWSLTGPYAEHRQRVWDYCAWQWKSLLPWASIYHGEVEGEWTRSKARNAGAAAAGDWQVAVFADADIVAGTADQVTVAVDEAQRTGKLVYAHTRRLQLGEAVTADVIDHVEDIRGATIEADNANTYSGIYAVPRQLWESVEGFDEQFIGWGFEDIVFMIACSAFGGGHHRVPGVIWHLWHPRGEEQHDHYPASEERWRRYVDCNWQPDAIREVRHS